MVITGFRLFLLQMLILLLFRFIFFFTFRSPTTTADQETTLKAFSIGFMFDMMASTYAVLLPVFLLLVNELIYKKTFVINRVTFVLTFCIYALYALVSCADLPYYRQFNNHLSKQAFLWNDSPAFVLGLIFGNLSYYAYLLLFLLMLPLLYILLKRIFRNYAELLQQKQPSYLRAVLACIMLTPLLIAGARGRLSSKSPGHEGLAIVSNDLFMNKVALNPNFTLFKSLLFQKHKSYKVPENINESLAFAKAYLGSDNEDPFSVSRQQLGDSVFKPWNIVVVCMESMSLYKTGYHNTEVLTPEFNNIISESILFDRFFSSGIHTFNGLFSTASSFPSMLNEQALRKYTRRPFTTLGTLASEKNYDTYFFSTHDPHFDNMSGFFTLNGYKKTYSSLDLPIEKNISVTGVPDHEIFNLFFDVVNDSTRQQPFLAYIMTGSDHGPWKIPQDIPFKPSAATEEKRATQYADWAIGELMRIAKKQNWYDNTLFVFTGDHGFAMSGTYEMPISYHHVPLVLHKPGTLKADTIHNLGCQTDITATVAGILGFSFINNTFGKNIIKEKHPFVYFTADDKMGCVSDDGYFYYELLSEKTKRLRKYPAIEDADYMKNMSSKADSLEKGIKHMLNAAEYLIRKNYYTY